MCEKTENVSFINLACQIKIVPKKKKNPVCKDSSVEYTEVQLNSLLQ